MRIKYPIEVEGIDFSDAEVLQRYPMGTEVGDFVSIRPCDDQYGGKTYLGIFLGQMATCASASYKPKTKRLEVGLCLHNAAIFVPDLNKVIFGRDSWWRKIEDENSLREITKSDIDNVWYVKALRQLSKGEV